MTTNKLTSVLIGAVVGLAFLVIEACTIRLRDDARETDFSSPIARDFNAVLPRLGPSHATIEEESDGVLKCREGMTETRGPLGERAAPSTSSDRDGCQAGPVLEVPHGDDSRLTPNSVAIPAPEGR
jgi:hypothetical protein